jgi:hypothetical protein
MASAVTLRTPALLIDVPGIALEGLAIEPRFFQHRTTKFWGVDGDSRIYGGAGGRQIQVPVLVYDATLYQTARSLADYIDYNLNGTAVGLHGTLDITSESNHSTFLDCSYEGSPLSPGDGIKHDDVGNLGGYYFALIVMSFRQLGLGEPE